MDITSLSVAVLIYIFLGLMMVSLYRVIAGPSRADRMTGLNLVAAQVLAVLVLLAVRDDLAVYLDVALVYDIFGFLGLLAIARYFGRERDSV